MSDVEPPPECGKIKGSPNFGSLALNIILEKFGSLEVWMFGSLGVWKFGRRDVQTFRIFQGSKGVDNFRFEESSSPVAAAIVERRLYQRGCG